MDLCYFYKRKDRGKISYRKNCKQCKLAQDKQNYQKNKERIIKRNRQWAIDNPDKRRNIENNYEKRNYEYRKNSKALKRACMKKTILSDKIKKELQTIYKKCKEITEKTGIIHHVDHIHPLKAKNSCGLHLPCNLQIIPATENLKKGNRYVG